MVLWELVGGYAEQSAHFYTIFSITNCLVVSGKTINFILFCVSSIHFRNKCFTLFFRKFPTVSSIFVRCTSMRIYYALSGIFNIYVCIYNHQFRLAMVSQEWRGRYLLLAVNEFRMLWSFLTIWISFRGNSFLLGLHDPPSRITRFPSRHCWMHKDADLWHRSSNVYCAVASIRCFEDHFAGKGVYSRWFSWVVMYQMENHNNLRSLHCNW